MRKSDEHASHNLMLVAATLGVLVAGLMSVYALPGGAGDQAGAKSQPIHAMSKLSAPDVWIAE